MEEFEELQEEALAFEEELKSLWKAVKSNDNKAQAESMQQNNKRKYTNKCYAQKI